MQAELEPQARAQAAAAAAAAATAVLLKAEPKPAQTNAVGSPQAVRAPRAAPVAAETNASLRPQHSRRFSRQNLMADRRAIQDAIVIAAIMQPCHAQRPYNVD